MQTSVQIHALETITRQLPQLVKELKRIADALEERNIENELASQLLDVITKGVTNGGKGETETEAAKEA